MNLLNILEKGETNSKSRSHLANKLNTSDRSVRQCVHNLRLQGHPIISSSNGSKGYYIASNDSEKQEFLRETKHRIDELQKVYKAVKG